MGTHCSRAAVGHASSVSHTAAELTHNLFLQAALLTRLSLITACIVQAVLCAGIGWGFMVRLGLDLAWGKLSEHEVDRARELREIVTSLGPAYIKLGQALSIRPDILSPAAMYEMQKLCDKVCHWTCCLILSRLCSVHSSGLAHIRYLT